MHILLTNDDGIFAPGLCAMYESLAEFADVTVVAPADVRSAASHSISLSPIIVNKVNINGVFNGYSVTGSPADCVKLAVMEIMKDKPDLIISGINDGANVGVNICYSGTVAAAMEGAFFKIPSIATSAALDTPLDFEKAVDYTVKVIKQMIPVEAGHVVNINIPQLSKGEPKGVKVVPQSTSGFEEKYEKSTDKLGQTVYQLVGGDNRHEDGETDIIALLEGYITVTALHYDMTEHRKTKKLLEKHTKFNI